jgi:hypothetical protein
LSLARAATTVQRGGSLDVRRTHEEHLRVNRSGKDFPVWIAGSTYGWSPWLATPASFSLPPELMIPRLNISPAYRFDLGNEIHLFPVCRCKGGTCVTPKS